MSEEFPTELEKLAESRPMPRMRSKKADEAEAARAAVKNQTKVVSPADWTARFDASMKEAEGRIATFMGKIGRTAMEPGLHSDVFILCSEKNGDLIVRAVNRSAEVAEANLGPHGGWGLSLGAAGTATISVQADAEGYPEIVQLGEFEPGKLGQWLGDAK